MNFLIELQSIFNGDTGINRSRCWLIKIDKFGRISSKFMVKLIIHDFNILCNFYFKDFKKI